MLTTAGRAGLVAIAALLALPCPGLAEVFVLPAVVAGVPGINGSVWETEVRVVRLSLVQELVVRRVWVATASGGFVDEPMSAPRWEFPPSSGTPRLLQLRGEELLTGAGASSGAVAVEVQGPAVVYLRSTNTANAPPVVGRTKVTRGNGWLTLAPSTPLHGPSTIAWSTAGVASWPEGFAYRTSVGLVNPSAVALEVQLRVASLMASNSTPAGEQDLRYWRDSGGLSEPVSVHIAPWGRLQLDDFYSLVRFCYPIGCYQDPGEEGPALIIVEAPTDATYFAYSSQIFSLLNDPEIVLAVPGLPEGIPYQ